MCGRVVSRLGLKRDFTQEPSLFLFSLSLSVSLYDYCFLSSCCFFFGFTSTEYTTLCLCGTHKYAGVLVLTQTNKHTGSSGLCSHWAEA